MRSEPAPSDLPRLPSRFAPTVHARLRTKNRTIKDIFRRANRSFARVFFAGFAGCDVIRIGRRSPEILPAPFLRLSALEIFAQRLLQPLPPQIVGLCGLPLALVVVVL